MATTIDDLRALGYEVNAAWGDVQTEQDALAAAQQAAQPDIIAEQAATVTLDTVQMLDQLGKLPDTDDERKQLAAAIADSALATLTTKASEKIDFHERALAIAQEQPNVFHVGSRLWNGYISCKDDGTGWDEDTQKFLDYLADPDVFAEGTWLADNPGAAPAMKTAAIAGVTVTRPKPGEDYFEADGKPYTLEQLVEYVATLKPLPSVFEKVATVLATAPELGDATRKALLAALEPPSAP